MHVLHLLPLLLVSCAALSLPKAHVAHHDDVSAAGERWNTHAREAALNDVDRFYKNRHEDEGWWPTLSPDEQARGAACVRFLHLNDVYKMFPTSDAGKARSNIMTYLEGAHAPRDGRAVYDVNDDERAFDRQFNVMAALYPEAVDNSTGLPKPQFLGGLHNVQYFLRDQVRQMRKANAAKQAAPSDPPPLFPVLEHLFTLGGDFLAPSYLANDITLGQHFVELLGRMGLDVTTFGNHEFDFKSPAGIDTWLPKSNFPWLARNVYQAADNTTRIGGDTPFRPPVHSLLPEAVLREWNITGATLPTPRFFKAGDAYNPRMQRLALEGGAVVCIGGLLRATDVKGNIADPYSEARSLLADMAHAGCHACVLVTHFDIEEDCKLAGMFPQIDLILGGHDHDVVLVKPFRDHHVQIIKARSDAHFLGHVDLVLDAAHAVVAVRHKLVPVHPFGTPWAEGVVAPLQAAARMPVGALADQGRPVPAPTPARSDDIPALIARVDEALLNSADPALALEQTLRHTAAYYDNLNRTDERIKTTYASMATLRADVIGAWVGLYDSSSVRFADVADGRMWADAIRQMLHADVAFMPSGSIRSDTIANGLPAFSMLDVYEDSPFPNTPVSFFATAAELCAIANFSLAERFGSGGFMQLSGVEVHDDGMGGRRFFFAPDHTRGVTLPGFVPPYVNATADTRAKELAAAGRTRATGRDRRFELDCSDTATSFIVASISYQSFQGDGDSPPLFRAAHWCRDHGLVLYGDPSTQPGETPYPDQLPVTLQTYLLGADYGQPRFPRNDPTRPDFITISAPDSDANLRIRVPSPGPLRHS